MFTVPPGAGSRTAASAMLTVVASKQRLSSASSNGSTRTGRHGAERRGRTAAASKFVNGLSQCRHEERFAIEHPSQ
jgi:hypothetical protein